MASKNPQVRAIEVEAARLANADGKTSLEERFALRNQLRAESGLKAEKRKLGGVAGVVDRNRNFVGNLAKNVAPLLTLIPGVGVPMAAAVGAAGRGIQKGANLGSIVKQGLSTATMAGGVAGAASGLNAAATAGKGLAGQVAGAGVGAVRGALDPFKRPVESGALKALPAPGAHAADVPQGAAPWEVPSVDGAAAAIPGAAAASGGWWDKAKDVAGRVAGAVTGGSGSAMDAGLLGLAGAQAVAAANASARSRGLSDDAIDLAKKNWAEGEDLRTAGRTRMLNPSRQDLSATYADPTNPFAAAPAAPDSSPMDAPPAAPPGVAPDPTRLARRRVPLPAPASTPVSGGSAASPRRAFR